MKIPKSVILAIIIVACAYITLFLAFPTVISIITGIALTFASIIRILVYIAEKV